MPLSRLQSTILKLLATHRDPESYVAGSAFLTRTGNRISGDIDIFHDREERVGDAADRDSEALRAGGLAVRWQRREPTFYQAIISDAEERDRKSTRLNSSHIPLSRMPSSA